MNHANNGYLFTMSDLVQENGRYQTVLAQNLDYVLGEGECLAVQVILKGEPGVLHCGQLALVFGFESVELFAGIGDQSIEQRHPVGRRNHQLKPECLADEVTKPGHFLVVREARSVLFESKKEKP